jgi:hypothetical protein
MIRNTCAAKNYTQKREYAAITGGVHGGDDDDMRVRILAWHL